MVDIHKPKLLYIYEEYTMVLWGNIRSYHEVLTCKFSLCNDYYYIVEFFTLSIVHTTKRVI